ncbi:hypothetical protein NDU88_005145 [Pleurodeles waltl]|uniref:Uncharacterized protein n=1 Tax=Pleurodeles waltl TaxID=8319 RepID=A0AAV7L401_PLEWA|nr:hypothetical protein NDU88_005145 [Pleurodeles waltl]
MNTSALQQMVINGSRSRLALLPSSNDPAQSNPCDNAALEMRPIGTPDEEKGMQDKPDICDLCKQLKPGTSRVFDNGEFQESDSAPKQLFPLFVGWAGRGSKETFTGSQPYIPYFSPRRRFPFSFHPAWLRYTYCEGGKRHQPLQELRATRGNQD